MTRLSSVLVATLLVASAAGAQQTYPLRPTPVVDPATVPRSPVIGGFAILRHTQRGDSATTLIRSARLGFRTRPMPFLVVRVQADLAGAGRLSADSSVGGFALTDAFVQLAPTDTARWRVVRPSAVVGQFKQPFSIEFLTPVSQILTPDRSLAVDRLSPRRDIGAMGQLDVGERVRLAAAVANGEGANARANPDRRQLYTARLTVVPLAGLALGGKVGSQAHDRMWGYDARWIAGGLVLEGEYLHRRRETGGAVASSAGGGYVMARYRATPWLRPIAKWERFEETAGVPLRATWLTGGAELANAAESVRGQLMVQRRREAPVDRRLTQLVAQLVVSY